MYYLDSTNKAVPFVDLRPEGPIAREEVSPKMQFDLQIDAKIRLQVNDLAKVIILLPAMRMTCIANAFGLS